MVVYEKAGLGDTYPLLLVQQVVSLKFEFTIALSSLSYVYLAIF